MNTVLPPNLALLAHPPAWRQALRTTPCNVRSGPARDRLQANPRLSDHDRHESTSRNRHFSSCCLTRLSSRLLSGTVLPLLPSARLSSNTSPFCSVFTAEDWVMSWLNHSSSSQAAQQSTGPFPPIYRFLRHVWNHHYCRNTTFSTIYI